MAKTSASFTLMDYTDGISLITGIDSNLPLTSLYDTANQTLSPSWAGDTSLILTPKVMKAGSSTSLLESMTNKTWQRRIAGGTYQTVTSGSNGENMNANTGALTVSEDKLIGDVWQIDYKFSGSYLDPILKLTFPVEIVVTLSRVANGTSFVVARAYAPSGSQFKNDEPSELTVKAELIRGTTTDTTNLSYTWQKSVNGTTWTDITAATSGYPKISATGETLTISSNEVDSFAMFRCKITDTDTASDTKNQTFTSEGVAFYDVSDPYQAVIESTAGAYFKNETGSTYLICRVYRNGEEVDKKGENLSYTWTKTDQNGTAETINPTGQAVGEIVSTNKKAISVSHNDVTVKATYFCSVD